MADDLVSIDGRLTCRRSAVVGVSWQPLDSLVLDPMVVLHFASGRDLIFDRFPGWITLGGGEVNDRAQARYEYLVSLLFSDTDA